MLVLRCTQKLLKRIGQPDADPPQSTTALGDWFAEPLSVGHQRYVLLASERSRLPILMPARDVKHLARNFPGALADMLNRLGVPEAAVKREVDAASEVLIAATNNRSVLGTLNDYSNMLQWTMPNRPNADLMDTAVWLAHTPVRPIDGFPDDVTRRLLGGRQAAPSATSRRAKVIAASSGRT